MFFYLRIEITRLSILPIMDYVTCDFAAVAQSVDAHFAETLSLQVAVESVPVSNQPGRQVRVFDASHKTQLSFCHLGDPDRDGVVPLKNFRSFQRASGYARATLGGIAQGLLEQGYTRAKIIDVFENGPSFWPRIGAVPYGHLNGLELALKSLRANPLYPTDGIALTGLLEKIGSRSLEETWIAATRKPSEGGLSRGTLEVLGERYEFKDNLVLDFTRPHVQKALGLGR